MSIDEVVATPHSSDAIVKTVRPNTKIRFRPNRSAHEPHTKISVAIANA